MEHTPPVSRPESQNGHQPVSFDTPGPPTPAPKASTFPWLARLFLIPMLIVVAFVMVFVLIKFIMGSEDTPVDYLSTIKLGGINQRWQAAYELSRILAHQKNPDPDGKLGTELIEAFKSAQNDDPRIQRYLVLAMGRMKDIRAVPVLLDALRDDDSDTRVYAVWALGAIGDTTVVPALIVLMEDDDSAVRKNAVYTLGNLKDRRAVPALRTALHDETEDVRWNAAIAIARFGDPGGLDILREMLDRRHLDEQARMTEEEKQEAMVGAIKAIVILRERSVLPVLTAISTGDPNLKVRQAAIEALRLLRTS